ncbi:MAG: hypothetical protein MdMp014T_1614 [Treponematales bacterium]
MTLEKLQALIAPPRDWRHPEGYTNPDDYPRALALAFPGTDASVWRVILNGKREPLGDYAEAVDLLRRFNEFNAGAVYQRRRGYTGGLGVYKKNAVALPGGDELKTDTMTPLEWRDRRKGKKLCEKCEKPLDKKNGL